MNTTISFEIAKMLKEKGFNERPLHVKSDTDYVEGYDWDIEDEEDSFKEREFQFEDNVCSHLYLKPTIADVIMWLYEKYGIWATSEPCVAYNGITNIYKIFKDNYLDTISRASKGYNSPTKAYEAAIEYTLKNLI